MISFLFMICSDRSKLDINPYMNASSGFNRMTVLSRLLYRVADSYVVAGDSTNILLMFGFSTVRNKIFEILQPNTDSHEGIMINKIYENKSSCRIQTTNVPTTLTWNVLASIWTSINESMSGILVWHSSQCNSFRTQLKLHINPSWKQTVIQETKSTEDSSH